MGQIGQTEYPGIGSEFAICLLSAHHPNLDIRVQPWALDFISTNQVPSHLPGFHA